MGSTGVGPVAVVASIGPRAEALEAMLAAWEALDQSLVAETTLYLILDEWDAAPPLLRARILERRHAGPWRAVEARTLNRGRPGLVVGYDDGWQWMRMRGGTHLLLIEDGLVPRCGFDVAMRRMLDAHPEFGWVACGQEENPRAPFTPLCSMMTRRCADAVGGYDHQFAPCQFDDADLMMRVIRAGFRPHACPRLVGHPTSRTSRVGTEAEDVALMRRHQARFFRKWGAQDFRWDLVPRHACEACT